MIVTVLAEGLALVGADGLLGFAGSLAALAAYVPARRATMVDAMSALRLE